MKNLDRVIQLQSLIKEAEELAKEEVHLQHNDRRLVRLAAILWVCRDVADEVVEQQIHQDRPENIKEGRGRLKRDHT